MAVYRVIYIQQLLSCIRLDSDPKQYPLALGRWIPSLSEASSSLHWSPGSARRPVSQHSLPPYQSALQYPQFIPPPAPPALLLRSLASLPTPPLRRYGFLQPSSHPPTGSCPVFLTQIRQSKICSHEPSTWALSKTTGSGLLFPNTGSKPIAAR